jgi:ribonuclease HI
VLNPTRGIAVFTDGSSWNKDRSGGWAWVAIDAFGEEEHGCGAESDTTNNRMELTAVVEALSTLADRYGEAEILLYSDSEYVVLGARHKYRARTKNRDLWEQLDDAEALHDMVEWNHVRGHKDSHYNNLADKLAGEARRGLR